MTELDVSKPSVLKPFLMQHGFSFKKGLGQNFLIDGNVLARIVDAAEAGPEDGVLEIGPGAGVVTQRMAMAARVVVAVEKDKSLQEVLADSLRAFPNTEIVFADVLEVDLPQLWAKFDGCRKVSVVANLPYYITTPILFHILDAHVSVANIVVMVQKEVADRLQAKPGTKDYGALTVAVQYRADVETVTRVSPGSFMPQPGVESSVVRLRCRPTPAVSVLDERLFFAVVRASFGMRRKTLLNALSAQLPFTKETCRDCLDEAAIDPMRRGETLSLSQFAAVADAFARRQPEASG